MGGCWPSTYPRATRTKDRSVKEKGFEQALKEGEQKIHEQFALEIQLVQTVT
jgi:hypothetical protein